jgi:hypothetical protein
LLTTIPSFTNAALAPDYFPRYVLAKQDVAVGISKAKVTTGKQRRPASINRAALMVASPSRIFYGENGKSLSPELIANFNHIKASQAKFNMADVIPMNMQPSNDSTLVFTQVADRSLSSFFNSKEVRESSFGRTATEVEQKMKQEVILGGGDSKSIQHKLNFNIQAFQTLAQIQYTGFTNAALRYNLTGKKLALEVFEKVAKNQDIILSQTMSSEDRLSEVSFRWTF